MNKQCPICGGFCGKVCERENVVESKEWDEPPHYKCDCKLCKEYWSDDIRTIYSGATRPPAEKLHVEFVAESPNSATNVVEPENTQAQELYGKTEQLKAEIKRLQELLEKNNA